MAIQLDSRGLRHGDRLLDVSGHLVDVDALNFLIFFGVESLCHSYWKKQQVSAFDNMVSTYGTAISDARKFFIFRRSTKHGPAKKSQSQAELHTPAEGKERRRFNRKSDVSLHLIELLR